MANTIFSLVFLASAPIFLMPSALAFFSKNKHAGAILTLNLVIWAGLYFLMSDSLVSSPQRVLALPVPVALLAWLVLLRFAISDGNTGPTESHARDVKTLAEP